MEGEKRQNNKFQVRRASKESHCINWIDLIGGWKDKNALDGMKSLFGEEGLNFN